MQGTRGWWVEILASLPFARSMEAVAFGVLPPSCPHYDSTRWFSNFLGSKLYGVGFAIGNENEAFLQPFTGVGIHAPLFRVSTAPPGCY